jgi:hypothetical protein
LQNLGKTICAEALENIKSLIFGNKLAFLTSLPDKTIEKEQDLLKQVS